LSSASGRNPNGFPWLFPEIPAIFADFLQFLGGQAALQPRSVPKAFAFRLSKNRHFYKQKEQLFRLPFL
jgi:hypothetical protein